MNADQNIEHCRWDELPKEDVRPGVKRAGFRGDDVLLVMNWLQPGMQTNPHRHPFEQIVYVVKGRMRFVVGDKVIDADAGSVIRVPPDVLHYGEPIGSEPVLNLDVFSPFREDYRHLVDHQKALTRG
ncbi:MAG: cupin domain-containing protein [Steroidobacteraceae bacterium]